MIELSNIRHMPISDGTVIDLETAQTSATRRDRFGDRSAARNTDITPALEVNGDAFELGYSRVPDLHHTTVDGRGYRVPLATAHDLPRDSVEPALVVAGNTSRASQRVPSSVLCGGPLAPRLADIVVGIGRRVRMAPSIVESARQVFSQINCCPGTTSNTQMNEFQSMAERVREVLYPGVEPVHNTLPDVIQKRARDDQIYRLSLDATKKGYLATRLDGGEAVVPRGEYVFVNLLSEPDSLLIMAGRAQRGFGHTSLVQNSGRSSDYSPMPVRFAGTILFSEDPEYPAELEGWTDQSGHYKPRAELRSTNITGDAKLMLKEALFRPLWWT